MSSEYRNEVTNLAKEARWTFWRLFWLIFFISIVLGVVGWGVTLLSRPAQIIERVTEPDRIIQNYEWFENTYNDAMALDRQIKTAMQSVDGFEQAAGPRADWKRADALEHSRLSSILQGLRNQRDNVVSDYNARSNQLTRRLFKGSTLPYQLDISDNYIVEVWEK